MSQYEEILEFTTQSKWMTVWIGNFHLPQLKQL